MVKALVIKLGQILTLHHARCVTAESCTGGLVAAKLTAYPGSSAWFDGGIVAYSNDVKQQVLGVPKDILATYGAVSAETVTAMAENILSRTQAHLSVAVSGIAGPDGGSIDKPVGSIWFAWASPGHSTQTALYQFHGSRTRIRQHCVHTAISGLIDLALKNNWHRP